MTRLTSALSSDYFDASGRLKGLKYTIVKVFVEGYDDIAFWRGVLNEFETDNLKFEISIPVRGDLAKGKKVVMEMIPQSGKNLILCVDSDFDYIFANFDHQSRLLNNSKYLFHTYVYATENYICYPPSLHSLCVKATKNDRKIFDFEEFMHIYSETIYPLFLWYAFSAKQSLHKVFPLIDFKNSVRINYLDYRDNGATTIAWLQRQVTKKLSGMERRYPRYKENVEKLGAELAERGVKNNEIYLYMQGHTLKDNVVLVLLQSVCDKLKEMSTGMISSSDRTGLSLKNELSNYSNSLRSIKEILEDNEGFKDCFLYKKLRMDIERFIQENYNPEKQDN